MFAIFFFLFLTFLCQVPPDGGWTYFRYFQYSYYSIIIIAQFPVLLQNTFWDISVLSSEAAAWALKVRIAGTLPTSARDRLFAPRRPQAQRYTETSLTSFFLARKSSECHIPTSYGSVSFVFKGFLEALIEINLRPCVCVWETRKCVCVCVCHQFAVLFEWKEMEEHMEENIYVCAEISRFMNSRQTRV